MAMSQHLQDGAIKSVPSSTENNNGVLSEQKPMVDKIDAKNHGSSLKYMEEFRQKLLMNGSTGDKNIERDNKEVSNFSLTDLNQQKHDKKPKTEEKRLDK